MRSRRKKPARHRHKAACVEVLEQRAMLSGTPVGDTLTKAELITIGAGKTVTWDGEIGDEPHGATDVDIFRVDMTSGQTLQIDMDAAALDGGGSLTATDFVLRIFNSKGMEIAYNDNGTDPQTGKSGADPYLAFAATSTEAFYIGVSAAGNTMYEPVTDTKKFEAKTGKYQINFNFDEGGSSGGGGGGGGGGGSNPAPEVSKLSYSYGIQDYQNSGANGTLTGTMMDSGPAGSVYAIEIDKDLDGKVDSSFTPNDSFFSSTYWFPFGKNNLQVRARETVAGSKDELYGSWQSIMVDLQPPNNTAPSINMLNWNVTNPNAYGGVYGEISGKVADSTVYGTTNYTVQLDTNGDFTPDQTINPYGS
ncbi:MAG: PPC domain-containing protein, partial [Planctomycetaceae bacterium]